MNTLIVSFGSTYTESYQRVFGPLKESIEGRVYECITSRFVKRKLEQRGIAMDSLEEALVRIKCDGVTTIKVLAVFMIPGYEYLRTEAILEGNKGWLDYTMTPAFLERYEDQVKLIHLLEEHFNEPGHTLYLLAHGSEHPSGATISQLQLLSESMGYEHVYESIDGFPDAQFARKRLNKETPILLYPLLFVAGDHAHLDLLERKEELLREGYRVEAILQGMGEFPQVIDQLLGGLHDR